MRLESVFAHLPGSERHVREEEVMRAQKQKPEARLSADQKQALLLLRQLFGEEGYAVLDRRESDRRHRLEFFAIAHKSFTRIHYKHRRDVGGAHALVTIDRSGVITVHPYMFPKHGKYELIMEKIAGWRGLHGVDVQLSPKQLRKRNWGELVDQAQLREWQRL